MRELSRVTIRFNELWQDFLKSMARYTLVRNQLQSAAEKLQFALNRQEETASQLLEENPGGAGTSTAASLNPLLHQLLTRIIALQQQLKVFLTNLSASAVFPATPEALLSAKSEQETPENAIPYAYIRPVVFLFLIADGFCVSFLPLYVNTLYQPVFGLSREVVIGLPISFYMLFFALSMPICGSWSDAMGWGKPLILGISLNAAGMLLTAAATDIFQLIVFRCITAVGFGMVFMSCQQFVMDNTLPGSRATGMASFLAAFFSGDLCGTVIGGMLADRIGYRAVFLVGGIISLFSLVCAAALFRKQLTVARKEHAAVTFPLKNLFRVLKDTEFCSVVFLQGIPAKIALIGFLYYFVPIYLKRLDTLQSNIGRVLMCYGVTLIFLNPLFSKLLKKAAYQRHFIAFGGLLTGLAMISFHFYSGLGAVLFLVVALGLAHTFSVPSQAAFIAETEIVKALGTGTGMGLFRFWERIGNIAGPLFLGFLMSWAGYDHAVPILGLITVVCTVTYLLIMTRNRHRRNEPLTERVEGPAVD